MDDFSIIRPMCSQRRSSTDDRDGLSSEEDSVNYNNGSEISTINHSSTARNNKSILIIRDDVSEKRELGSTVVLAFTSLAKAQRDVLSTRRLGELLGNRSLQLSHRSLFAFIGFVCVTGLYYLNEIFNSIQNDIDTSEEFVQTDIAQRMMSSTDSPVVWKSTGKSQAIIDMDNPTQVSGLNAASVTQPTYGLDKLVPYCAPGWQSSLSFIPDGAQAPRKQFKNGPLTHDTTTSINASSGRWCGTTCASSALLKYDNNLKFCFDSAEVQKVGTDLALEQAPYVEMQLPDGTSLGKLASNQNNMEAIGFATQGDSSKPGYVSKARVYLKQTAEASYISTESNVGSYQLGEFNIQSNADGVQYTYFDPSKLKSYKAKFMRLVPTECNGISGTPAADKDCCLTVAIIPYSPNGTFLTKTDNTNGTGAVRYKVVNPAAGMRKSGGDPVQSAGSGVLDSQELDGTWTAQGLLAASADQKWGTVTQEVTGQNKTVMKLKESTTLDKADSLEINLLCPANIADATQVGGPVDCNNAPVKVEQDVKQIGAKFIL